MLAGEKHIHLTRSRQTHKRTTKWVYVYVMFVCLDVAHEKKTQCTQQQQQQLKRDATLATAIANHLRWFGLAFESRLHLDVWLMCERMSVYFVDRIAISRNAGGLVDGTCSHALVYYIRLVFVER